MVSGFGFVLLFILGSIVLVTTVLGVAKLLKPNNPNVEKLETYESGEDTVGDAHISFNIRFYTIAIIFILFDVELVLLFPWATVFGNKILILETAGNWAWFTIIEMFIFILILALGLVYAWKQGFLEWVKPKNIDLKTSNTVPNEFYDKINSKYS